MRTIAHIIKPVKVDRSSDLYLAQPITFETMRIAKKFATNKVDVQLYSTQYPEDAYCVPEDFYKTRDLDRYVEDIFEFRITRKLPILKDILDRLYQESDAEFFVYTNVDIALMPYFYVIVNHLIDEGFDAFVINRRTISQTHTKIDEIPYMYAEIGEGHKGFDCFIFRRDVYHRYELKNVCIGTGWVGRVLLWNLVLHAKKFKEFQDLHVTFHLGNDSSWRESKYSDYFDYNNREAYKVLSEFKKNRPGSLEILDRYTYLRLFDMSTLDTFEKNIQSSHTLESHKFLFIAGLHKSGTSILWKCLGEHPCITGFASTGYPQDEGQFLQSAFPFAKRFGGPGKFGFAPEMHLTEDSPLVTKENRTKLFSEWSRYWDTNQPVLLEKSPPNLLKTRFLQVMFPNVYFVVILRHPIATSYATQKWSKTDISSLLKHWLHCHRVFFEDKQCLKNCLIIKYEDFVVYPNRYLREIYNMIGIEALETSQKIKKDMNTKYLAQWKKYREHLNILQKAAFRLKYTKIEKEINTFGYSLYD